MLNIPMNTYRIEDDPRVEEIVTKCLPLLAEKGKARICMYGFANSDEIVCRDEGREAIVAQVIEHFHNAGYHCAYMQNSCFKRLSAIIAKKPIDKEYGCEEIIY